MNVIYLVFLSRVSGHNLNLNNFFVGNRVLKRRNISNEKYWHVSIFYHKELGVYHEAL